MGRVLCLGEWREGDLKSSQELESGSLPAKVGILDFCGGAGGPLRA